MAALPHVTRFWGCNALKFLSIINKVKYLGNRVAAITVK